ncbi:MAG TPA: c-type cytochrome [Bryobacteraceae bacterium]|nr:c-type cytochrome [Bryobacteraceae bacterium]
MRVTRLSWAFVAPAAVCLALLCSGCEPWGKPGPDPVDPTEVTEFKTLFAQNCAGCHGENGKLGPGRILNDPLYQAWIPRDALQHVIEYGRPGTAMPPWAIKQGGPLQPSQITALVDGMKQNWAKPASLHGAALPPYENDKSAGSADNGRKLFLRSCFACHGPGARIGLVTDPSYLALTTNQNLRTAIVVGRPDFGMPDYRFLKAGRALTDQDIADVVAFLASKRPAGSLGAEQEARGGK